MQLSLPTKAQWYSVVKHALILGASAGLASLLDAVTNNPSAFGRYALLLALVLKLAVKFVTPGN